MARAGPWGYTDDTAEVSMPMQMAPVASCRYSDLYMLPAVHELVTVPMMV